MSDGGLIICMRQPQCYNRHKLYQEALGILLLCIYYELVYKFLLRIALRKQGSEHVVVCIIIQSVI